MITINSGSAALNLMLFELLNIHIKIVYTNGYKNLNMVRAMRMCK